MKIMRTPKSLKCSLMLLTAAVCVAAAPAGAQASSCCKPADLTTIKGIGYDYSPEMRRCGTSVVRGCSGHRSRRPRLMVGAGLRRPRKTAECCSRRSGSISIQEVAGRTCSGSPPTACRQ